MNAAQPELTPVPNFFVKKGQRLIIVTPQNTRAQWRIASPSAPRGGMTGPGGLREVVNGFHRGALVAQIGNGPVFAVGVRYFGTANEDGQLKLGCWDDNYQDHEGTIPVDVVRGD